MNEKKLSLIEKAIKEFEVIYPCRNARMLEDCFTVSGDKLFFWFNDRDHSTHILSEDIFDEEP